MGIGRIVIHCNPDIAWQAARAVKFEQGLRALGFDPMVCGLRQRVSDIAILFGTTFWRDIEADTGRFLLVDRASIGDPDYVSLVWDGHGRRGDHKVPARVGEFRWRRLNRELYPWRLDASRRILCGQTETYSPRYPRLEDWYAECMPFATHFRRHPAGANTTALPGCRDWTDAGLTITLNSSVGIESVLNGIPTVTMDEAAMAWDVTSHSPDSNRITDRRPWCHWLAWTQWHWDEIAAGEPIRHLFEEL